MKTKLLPEARIVYSENTSVIYHNTRLMARQHEGVTQQKKTLMSALMNIHVLWYDLKKDVALLNSTDG